MGKAINGLCLHGYMLNLVWVELKGVQVGSGGRLHRGGCERCKGREKAEAHRPQPTKGLGMGGGPGRAVVCAGVGAGGYGARRGVLYMFWAWHRLDLHGDTCGLSRGNFVNKRRLLRYFAYFAYLTYCALCTGYQLIGMPCAICSRRITSWGVLKDFGLRRKAHVHGVEQP